MAEFLKNVPLIYFFWRVASSALQPRCQRKGWLRRKLPKISPLPVSTGPTPSRGICHTMRLETSGVLRLLCAAGFLLALVPDVLAQQSAPENGGRPTVEAARLAEGESIELDGRLDEAVWSRALPAKDFIQIDPSNGRPATERTEVRIAFDADALYMGVTAFDSDPDGWLGFERRRDQFLGADDRFMWTIDTFLDARSGYFFEMNPSGLMADSWFGINGDNRQWDGIWDARARRSEIGWILEIKIPFRTRSEERRVGKEWRTRW